MSDRQDPSAIQDFSLVMGGPLYRFLLTTRFARPPLDLLRRRVAVIAGIAWLPLLVLAETVVHERFRPVSRHFLERGIIRPEGRDWRSVVHPDRVEGIRAFTEGREAAFPDPDF